MIFEDVHWIDSTSLEALGQALDRIRILRVTPESAEFWEGAGAIVTAVKLIAASVSGERMNLGKNEKVGFES